MAFGQPRPNPAFLSNMDGFLSGMSAQPAPVQQPVPVMAPAPAAPPSAAPVQAPVGPLAQAMQPKPKINWLGVLADALSGAAGKPALYAERMAKERELAQQQTLEEQTYQHRQASELQQAISLYDYKLKHPETPQPTGVAADLISMGIMPGTAEFNQRMNAHLQAQDDPTVTVPVGKSIYTGPRSGIAAALAGGGASNPDSTPTVEDGYAYTPGPGGRANQQNWKPQGGQTPRASGNFPR